MLNFFFSFVYTFTLALAPIQETSTITIVLQDGQANPVEGISVMLTPTQDISSNQRWQATSNSRGLAVFNNLKTGNYILTTSHLGYRSETRNMPIVSGEGQQLQITLSPASQQLEDVVVFGKSATEMVREQAVRAVVVELTQAAEQPASLAEVINRSPGIRIRQSGGLGNAVDISINGFQGNSVQYFKDGIPLEYLGGGYGLNNVPVNLLERVEVYKGVVPVSLGGDALGGAVNMVTHSRQRAHVSASYEVASFNTHIAQLSLYQTLGSTAFVGADAFYNYSDNNYQADVQVVDEQSNPVSVTVPLFHNGYKQHFIEAYGGLKNLSWADELRFSIAQYDIERESQHPALMTNAYGALMTYNLGLIPSMRYLKKSADGRFAVDQFLSYSQIDRSRVDTVQGTFNWFGDFNPGTRMGESPRTSLSDINFNNFLNRTNLTYRFAPNHKIEANLVYSHSSRLGSDPYGLRFSGTEIDVLSKEAIYRKTILGLSWESNWLDGQLTNQATVKYFGFGTSGINGFMANATDLDQFTTTNNHDFGIGNAIKYTLNPQQFIRASVELTNRLPRDFELFGDNDTRAPNFQLKPERSFNANLGYSFNGQTWRLEIGTFYRRTQGMILLVPVQPPFAQYQNLDSIRGYGFDVDAHYQLTKNWNISGNMTWQDNRMVDISEGLYKWIEGTRLRNTPYFFANMAVNAHYTGLFQTSDAFKPYLHWNFIREFYLNHIPSDKEPQGFLGLWGKSGVPVTNLVPNQHLVNLGFTYYLAQQPLSIGFEVKNITDTKLYDYYKIQRPGRSMHLKLNYTLMR